MISAVSALVPRLANEVFAKIPALEVPKFPPPPPPDPTAGAKMTAGGASLRQLADGWCGTVPRPLPLPKGGGSIDDWCGTRPRPFPLPVPPTPPQPWLDLAKAAQAFR